MDARATGIQVHLFCLPALQAQGGAVTSCEEELLLVAGVRSASRRAEIVHGRAALRALLAQATGTDVDALRLRRDERGKPSAVLACGRPAPPFNVSHSNGVLAIAVGPGAEDVGIDVEGPATGLAPDIEAIARSQFAPAERAAVLAAPPARRMQVFMRVWTLKEAVLKAAGTGLCHPLRTVEVGGQAESVRCELGASRKSIRARHYALAPAWHLAVARCGELPPVALHWMTALPALGAAGAASHACPTCCALAAGVVDAAAGAAVAGPAAGVTAEAGVADVTGVAAVSRARGATAVADVSRAMGEAGAARTAAEAGTSRIPAAAHGGSAGRMAGAPM